MSRYSDIVVFGEVLFDCFPSGEKLLGGAPFNVAYHLQALGAPSTPHHNESNQRKNETQADKNKKTRKKTYKHREHSCSN